MIHFRHSPIGWLVEGTIGNIVILTSEQAYAKTGSGSPKTVAQQRFIDDDTAQVQVVSWYDNENSYSCQMVRTIKYFDEL